MDEIDSAIMDVLESSQAAMTPTQIQSALTQRGVDCNIKKVRRRMRSLVRFGFVIIDDADHPLTKGRTSTWYMVIRCTERP